MKKLLIILIIPLFFWTGNAFGQSDSTGNYRLAQNSWTFGFGIKYPRYISTDLQLKGLTGYGGYLSIQRNFTEHVGLRLSGSINHLQGDAGKPLVTIKNDFIEGDFDLLYYLVPCESISPYLGLGAGGVYYNIKNSPQKELNKAMMDYTVNLLFGVEWSISTNWRFDTELGYHTVGTSNFDGMYGTVSGGILGGNTDSYMNFNLGIKFYFAKGKRSHLCDMYDGINQIDYKKIEDIVKKYANKPTKVDYNRIENIVKRNEPSIKNSYTNWVLVGVNFDLNSAKLKPESIPILYNVTQTLLTHPEIKVEIQGYSDNTGPASYNKKLSLKRAETVKKFLESKGIAAKRLSAVGMGEVNPVASNKTAAGRALNRRIEFKVLSK